MPWVVAAGERAWGISSLGMRCLVGGVGGHCRVSLRQYGAAGACTCVWPEAAVRGWKLRARVVLDEVWGVFAEDHEAGMGMLRDWREECVVMRSLFWRGACGGGGSSRGCAHEDHARTRTGTG